MGRFACQLAFETMQRPPLPSSGEGLGEGAFAHKTCFVLLTMSAVLGCTGGDDRRGAASGEVTLDGQPVVEGAITFRPAEGNSGPVAGGPIDDGHYRIRQDKGPVIGKNRVEIRVPHKTGRQIPHPANPSQLMDEWINAAPPEYNEQSTQVVDVKRGKNKFDFHMDSE